MSKLFQPLQIGSAKLQHRVVMAPLTRLRVDDKHMPLPFVQEYYFQRSAEPGTLIISEGFIASSRQGGYTNIPGIYTEEQADSWKSITAAVHANGGFIFAQIGQLGRVELPCEENGHRILGPSAVPLDDTCQTPDAMTEAEIQEMIDQFVSAAKKSINAGFDGIEIHGANGYLVDQFTQDHTNQRTDRWGGSVENRSRFGVEVAKAIAAAIGPEKTGYRISPYSEYQGMRMKDSVALEAQFRHLVGDLKKLGLAYLHVIEARVNGPVDGKGTEIINYLVQTWGKDKPVLIAGGQTPESAQKLVNETFEDHQVAVVFGRYFISNPDLPYKIRNGVKLTPYDRSSFYTIKSPIGYTDYPFSPEFEAYRNRVSKTT